MRRAPVTRLSTTDPGADRIMTRYAFVVFVAAKIRCFRHPHRGWIPAIQASVLSHCYGPARAPFATGCPRRRGDSVRYSHRTLLRAHTDRPSKNWNFHGRTPATILQPSPCLISHCCWADQPWRTSPRPAQLCVRYSWPLDRTSSTPNAIRASISELAKALKTDETGGNAAMCLWPHPPAG